MEKHFHWRAAISSVVTLRHVKMTRATCELLLLLQVWFIYSFFSRPLRSLLQVVVHQLASLSVACGQGRVSDGVLGVAGEGHGDGVASPPRHLLHTVKVLRARGEEADPSWMKRSEVRGGKKKREFDKPPQCRGKFPGMSVCFFESEDTGAKRRTCDVRTLSSSLVLIHTDDIFDLVFKTYKVHIRLYSFPKRKTHFPHYQIIKFIIIKYF